MTGYEVPRKVFRLTFDEHPGLEVDVQEMPLGMLFGLLSAADGFDEDNIQPEDMPKLEELLKAFSRVLHGWNFTDQGEPLPATYDGLAKLPPGLALRILKAGLESITAAPPPLPGGSGSGPELPEVSLPMETLPVSQPN